MKKLLFSAIAVVSVVGTALAVNTTKLGSKIYCESTQLPQCATSTFDVAITATPTLQIGFCTVVKNDPCRELFLITAI